MSESYPWPPEQTQLDVSNPGRSTQRARSEPIPALPVAAIQVLTNNLLYDFSQTTIPTDKASMKNIWRQRERIAAASI
jgi:hypothetical protein